KLISGSEVGISAYLVRAGRLRRSCSRLLCALTSALPLAASAHTFGTVYNLPVPFSMYAYGASRALIVSFAIAPSFAAVAATGGASSRPEVQNRASARSRSVARLSGVLLFVLRAISVLALTLAIVAGFVGTVNPYTNINMTLFWIVFVLACFYAAALV